MSPPLSAGALYPEALLFKEEKVDGAEETSPRKQNRSKEEAVCIVELNREKRERVRKKGLWDEVGNRQTFPLFNRFTLSEVRVQLSIKKIILVQRVNMRFWRFTN